jgi:hypothetical protein
VALGTPAERAPWWRDAGALTNPAGGLRYHWRALRHRRGCWQPFVVALGDWLAGWRPATDRVVLVGPSAGWCLPEAVLARFESLTGIEPDPLARRLFARRFPNLASHLRWHAADYLVPVDGELRAERLHALVRDFPSHAFLFCNVLGQLPYLHRAAVEQPSFAVWKHTLAAVFAERPFASFHDRLSGACVARPEALGATLPVPLGSADLAERYLVTGAGAVEVEDHATGDLFPGRPRTLLAWEITPGWTHLVEAVRSDGASATG